MIRRIWMTISALQAVRILPTQSVRRISPSVVSSGFYSLPGYNDLFGIYRLATRGYNVSPPIIVRRICLSLNIVYGS